ncbi:MAG: LysM peptidoglycan-binding domain-containing protein [Chloroflexi bacterium]|nr:LysM peptidoglycan-binding domain-containing protein [Chloroflexota bacterium]
MTPNTPRSAARHGLRAHLPAILLVALAVALPVSLASANQTHEVQPGETLSSIAARYGLSLEAIAADNGIADPNVIFAGQVLRVGPGEPAVAPPATRSHTVAEGEFLLTIARDHGVTLGELLEINAIADPNVVYVGQVLEIPPARNAPPPLSHAETEVVIRAAAEEFGVWQPLLLGLAWLESGWNQAMVSPVGAIGTMQLMPATAEWGLEYLAPDAVNWETNARDNIRLGAAVYAQLLQQADWDIELALAFYYQGWKSIETYGMFEDTHEYVANVMALARQFE